MKRYSLVQIDVLFRKMKFSRLESIFCFNLKHQPKYVNIFWTRLGKVVKDLLQRKSPTLGYSSAFKLFRSSKNRFLWFSVSLSVSHWRHSSIALLYSLSPGVILNIIIFYLPLPKLFYKSVIKFRTYIIVVVKVICSFVENNMI